jgi:hypothetical protein
VDPSEQNAAMVEKLALPFPVLADPDGAVMRSLDAWDEEEGIGRPTIIVVDHDGREALRIRSRDFADRPDDNDVLAALDRLGLPPRIDVLPVRPGHPRPGPRALTLEELRPYFRGVRFIVAALAKRVPEAREDADQILAMVKRFNEALTETRRIHTGASKTASTTEA